MGVEGDNKVSIVRTERGLSISNTRITLYDVLDYANAGYPPVLIREKLCLTDAQVSVALSYIERNRAEVDAEYQKVLKMAEENRRYWEERNREHFSKIKNKPVSPEKQVLIDKLQEWKDRINAAV